jgi:hypothetical protein
MFSIIVLIGCAYQYIEKSSRKETTAIPIISLSPQSGVGNVKIAPDDKERLRLEIEKIRAETEMLKSQTRKTVLETEKIKEEIKILKSNP